MIVKVQRLPGGEGLPLPSYGTEHAAGLDLYAAIAEKDEKELYPGCRWLIPTGIAVDIPVGYEIQIRPRSGLANKNGLTVLNSPGTIDADYRGQICVLLINHSDGPLLIQRGMRIAQAVLTPVLHIEWEEMAELVQTTRGAGGFGSTGI